MGTPRSLILGLAIITLVASTASAQSVTLEPGDRVTFAVSAVEQITGGEGGDEMIFTGKSVMTSNVGNCFAAGQFPIQSGIFIDPGDQRATRSTNIIGFAHTAEGTVISCQIEGTVISCQPIRNGTRLVNLSDAGTCTIDAAPFVKLTGIVK